MIVNEVAEQSSTPIYIYIYIYIYMERERERERLQLGGLQCLLQDTIVAGECQSVEFIHSHLIKSTKIVCRDLLATII